MAIDYIYHEFVHKPTVVRARYVERDIWITDENGRPKLIEAPCWEVWGVENRQYFVKVGTFDYSYDPKAGEDELYYNEVMRNQ